ncbi:uncharacterized protein LOC141538163 [Cotesia typhae]|uniref:uncharacterized protein LOC141538163 n=1 Tax=Cotesia typhae TaxID=2053667 RepID=UPI003D694196
MKLLIILLMNIYLAKSSVDEVLIHGPNTPVYMCELVNGHVKVETKKQKFDNKTAKNSYDEAMYPKLLVVVGYKDYSKNGEQKSLDHAYCSKNNRKYQQRLQICKFYPAG